MLSIRLARARASLLTTDLRVRRAGIYGQTIHIDQASRVVVVKFSTHPEPAGELFGDMFTAITALAQGIGGAKL